MYGMDIRLAGWYRLSGVNVMKVKDEERKLGWRERRKGEWRGCS